MIFTIEPMINLGNYETKTLNDGWTVVTKDKSLSAQFEHDNRCNKRWLWNFYSIKLSF